MAEYAEENGGQRRNRWSLAIWGTAAFLLLVPLVGMQFTSQVNWDETGIVMGLMLSAACGTYELAARTTGNGSYRLAVGIAVLAAFLLIWINLAVGIIGTEDNALNLMYGGVLAVALVGAAIARFEPEGMGRAFVVTAVAQLLVGIIALTTGHFTLVLEGFFAALWLIAAALFRKAARQQSAGRAAVEG